LELVRGAATRVLRIDGGQAREVEPRQLDALGSELVEGP